MILSDTEKIVIYIRKLTPWSLAKHVLLTMCDLDYWFADDEYKHEDIKIRIEDNYDVFVDAFLRCAAGKIFVALTYSPTFLNDLDGQPLNSMQEITLRKVFKQALNAKEKSRQMYEKKRDRSEDKRKWTDDSSGPKVKRAKVEEAEYESDMGEDQSWKMANRTIVTRKMLTMT